MEKYLVRGYFFGQEDSPCGALIAEMISTKDGSVVRTAAKDLDTLVIKLKADYGFSSEDLPETLQLLIDYIKSLKEENPSIKEISGINLDQLVNSATNKLSQLLS